MPLGGVPQTQTVDAVMRVIDLHVRVHLLLLVAALVAGGVFTPLILFLTGAVGNLAALLPFGGGGAAAVGVLPVAAYLKWHSRKHLCADYRRWLIRRRKSAADDGGEAFEIATRQFWELYGDVWKK